MAGVGVGGGGGGGHMQGKQSNQLLFVNTEFKI